MEECLSATLCFPMLTPAPGVRKSTQWPTVQEALHPCAESCSVSVQDCRGREIARDGSSAEDPPTRLPRGQRIGPGDLFTSSSLYCPGNVTQISCSLCLHGILPFHCPEPRAQLLQNLQGQPFDLSIRRLVQHRSHLDFERESSDSTWGSNHRFNRHCRRWRTDVDQGATATCAFSNLEC